MPSASRLAAAIAALRARSAMRPRLRTRIALLGLLAFLAPALLSLWLLRHQARQQEAMAASALAGLALRSAQDQAAPLLRANTLLAGLALAHPGEAALCRAVRDSQAEEPGLLHWLALADAEGRLLCASQPLLETLALPAPLPDAMSDATTPGLQRGASGPLGGLLLRHTLPGLPGRSLVAALDRSGFRQAILAPAGAEQVLLLDQAGRTLLRLPEEPANPPLALPDGVAERMRREGWGSLRSAVPGQAPLLLGFARLPGSEAMVVALRGEAGLAAPQGVAWRVTLLMLGLSALAALGAGIWAARAEPPPIGDTEDAAVGLLEAIAATMGQGVALWSLQGRLLTANQRWRSLLGLPASLAAPGSRLPEVAQFLAEGQELGAEPLALRLQGSAPAGPPLPRPGGRSVALRAHRLADSIVTTCSDVTEAAAAEAALRESEARFRLIAENSGDVVALCDMDGRRRYVSPASERVLGYRPEALADRLVGEFVHPDDQDWVEAAAAALRSGDPEASATYRFRRPDESWLWVDVRARSHADPATGRPIGYVAVMRDATEAKAAEARLLEALERMEEMATTDALTGLANRRRFEEALALEWRRCAREGLPLSVLLLDADRFKRFNDRYGHPAGDECLRLVAASLAGVARRPGDVAARHGGEEFALLMPKTDAAGAALLAERVRAAVAEAKRPHLGNPPAGIVTVSIGVATTQPVPETGPAGPGILSGADALLSAADRALYAAKMGGRNRICVASPELGALLR
ncbi:diguanylate cyclase domain-containing protein [Pseudoroseomonas cervicalis]|uniref:diguanylate cyclase domain-containing protein n=1 Tax=Teichococcus cervicalis TaxID=204525 RepID=UPI0022F1C9E6|nr:diguanylate cyclase [Pseudoroseomonas cervicalis]WBV45092.1 diguanylate cyclase [Pseudoroseomonas cervicalis]